MMRTTRYTKTRVHRKSTDQLQVFLIQPQYGQLRSNFGKT